MVIHIHQLANKLMESFPRKCTLYVLTVLIITENFFIKAGYMKGNRCWTFHSFFTAIYNVDVVATLLC